MVKEVLIAMVIILGCILNILDMITKSQGDKCQGSKIRVGVQGDKNYYSPKSENNKTKKKIINKK